MDASLEELYTQMNVSADANDYIVVYPNGLSNAWNSWFAPGGAYPDDVKFLSELIDTISARYNVNSKRVYSCGLSNGGYMSYTLACSIADKLAAIASVSGTMSAYTYSTCAPSRKIPIMHVHGTLDPTVAYGGASGSIGVEQTIAFWRDTDACQNISDTIDMPNLSTTDNCTAQRIHYPNCANGNDILFYKIIGGGHTWPSAFLDAAQYGNTNHDISATNEIWTFFNRYTLDGPVTTGISDVQKGTAINVYPNPASSVLNITSDNDVIRADIYDAAGRKVLSSEKNKSINISSLEAGMYIAKVNCMYGIQSVVKFTKQ
jgi:polyhydroxybutyrate depolymerase